MIGLPHETMDDIKALIDLAVNLKKENRGFELTFSIANFIPKAHTPFENVEMESFKTLEKKMLYVMKNLRKKKIGFRASSIEWDVIQAVLSRSEKSLADYIIEVCERGGNLGAFKHVWAEFHKLRRLKDLKDAAMIPYTKTRKKMPWSFIKAVPEGLIENRQREYLSLI